jgi:hypothetical protein
VGYSGFASVQEKYRSPANEEYTFRLPYYNGIDLRFNFTGVEKLSISLLNNISFSTMRGSDDGHIVTVGVGGEASQYYDSYTYQSGGTTHTRDGLSDSDISDGYLALSNALGVQYKISDPLYVSLQLANRLYSYTKTAEVNASRNRGTQVVETYGSDDFRAALGAGYSFGDHVSLETGLAFDLLNYSHRLSTDDTGNTNYDWGTFTFGIPIKFKVVLP